MVLGGFNENQDLSDVALDRTCARKTGNPENPVSAVSFNRLLLRLQRHEPHKYKLRHRLVMSRLKAQEEKGDDCPVSDWRSRIFLAESLLG